MELEDNFADVVGKAQHGLGLSDTELATRAGITTDALRKVRAEHFNADALRKLAPVLNLDADALVALPRYHPEPVQDEEIPGFASFTTLFGEMKVNSFLVWDIETGEAAAFDTGADCTGMLDLLRQHHLKLKSVFLTHTHGDHRADSDRLQSETGATLFTNKKEPWRGNGPAATFETGAEFACGPLRIETRLTWGHTRGGTSYVVHGLARPVVIVGDAMFAGSMGGGMLSHVDGLRTDREQILTLPPETIICPGHGPMTTVGEELQNNPFFA